MDTNPSLEPKTKELWAGIRSTTSKQSTIQRYITELRSRVSGIVALQAMLEQSSTDSFSAYETELKSKTDVRAVSDSDAEEARDIVENESSFSSYSDYAGDAGNGTGVHNQSDYDAYRGYLTSNGVGNVDADVHNRTIKRLYTPGDTFIDQVVNESTSFDELETWLDNQGFASEDATAFRDELEGEFADWSSFETFLDNADSIEALLDRYAHTETATTGIEYDEDTGTLYLRYETELRMQQWPSESVDNPDETASISFSNVSVSDTTPVVDTEITVSADATNSGGSAGTAGSVLVVNNATRDWQTVDVPANSTRTVRYTVSFDSVGEYDVRVNDASTVTVTAIPPNI